MSDHPFVVVRGAVMAAVFITLWVWFASLVHRLDPLVGISLPDYLRPVGWIIGAAGLATGLTCVFLFITRGRGTPAPFDPPKVFVASGPYRYVRNPMYVGAVLALTGAAFILHSVAILGLMFVFWLLAHLMVVLNEEPALERRFGESFAEYKRQTNRWLPMPPHQLTSRVRSQA